MLEIVNWLLALGVAAFLYQILTEMLFADRGKYCVGCGLRDLPKSFVTCEHCGLELALHVERVHRRERLFAYGFPVTSLLATAYLHGHMPGEGYLKQVVVAVFVVGNSLFAIGWLASRDSRLRLLFNVPFWTAVALAATVVAFDMTIRTAVMDGQNVGTRGVADMEIELNGTPCLAMKDGSLSKGVGSLAFAHFRGLPVRRLIRGGNGELLVYAGSRALENPDALIGLDGVQFNPARSRVTTAIALLLGTTQLSPSQRSTLDRATHQQGVDFCASGDLLWLIDGATIYRIYPAGTMDSLSLGSRQVGRLLKIAAGEGAVYVLSANGLTGVSLSTSRKEYYPLAEFASRRGQQAAEIVAGAVHGGVVWFATVNGDVFSFDLKKERLRFEGAAACPLYLDYYSLYTLPFVVLALFGALRANFPSRRRSGGDSVARARDPGPRPAARPPAESKGVSHEPRE